MILNRFLSAFAIAALLASCSAEPTTNAVDAGAITLAESGVTGSVQTVKSNDAKALLDQQKNVVILDVRTSGEYGEGHLTNAMNIDFYSSDFTERLRKLDASQSYMVYCAVGGRSREAANLMQQLGFQHVYDATEGYTSLKQAGVAVEK